MAWFRTGTCNNGLVPAVALVQTTSGDGSAQHPYSTTGTADSNTTRYKTMAGGATVTLTCTPEAKAAGNNGTGVTVGYTASISPVFVIPGGAIQDSSGNYNILVGQGCTSSLTGIPSALLNNSANPPTYKWSVSGITFQNWTVTSSGNTSTAAVTNGLGPTTNATAHWYWDDNSASETITCTVIVTPPSGQGSAFPITATQNVSLAIPQTTESPTVGRVQINNHSPTGYGTNYALYVGGNASQPYGIIFTTQVLTPALFASTSSGIWNMVQGVAPNNWETPYQKLEQPDPNNGKSGLDTRYPFYPTSSSSFPQGIPANNLIAQPYDGPGIPNLSNLITRYRTADNFQTFVMYLPPGSDTQWVPVWLVTWGWTADDTIPTFWSNWNDATNAGTVAVTGNSKTLIFPVWTIVITG